jgi:hypothetical protein
MTSRVKPGEPFPEFGTQAYVFAFFRTRLWLRNLEDIFILAPSAAALFENEAHMTKEYMTGNWESRIKIRARGSLLLVENLTAH